MVERAIASVAGFDPVLDTKPALSIGTAAMVVHMAARTDRVNPRDDHLATTITCGYARVDGAMEMIASVGRDDDRNCLFDSRMRR